MVPLQNISKGAITMDYAYSTTMEAVRKSGKHFTLDERGQIQALHREGFSLRAIAARVGCSHTAIHYELKRGTPERQAARGRSPQYTAKRGQQAYLEHRKNSKRPYKLNSAGCAPFLRWMTERIRKNKWSIDMCVGDARANKWFDEDGIPCTKTLYNMLWAGRIPLTLFDVPQALGRKCKHKRNRKNKRLKGRSIEERPALVDEGTEIGHWEADTVVGSRKGRGAAVFTAVEKVTHDYIAIRISGRTCAGIEEAIAHLKSEYGEDRFSQVFKTITVDNGTECETFTQLESLGTKVYFAPPYSSWERPQNERHNGILRQYIPKGTGIDGYSDEDILNIADEINSRPRRVFGYQTPAELFNTFLDEVYAIENVS